MDFREKKRRHDSWVQAGKALSAVMRKYGVSRLNTDLYTSLIESRFPGALPSCECREDGDKALGVVPKLTKNGSIPIDALFVSFV